MNIQSKDIVYNKEFDINIKPYITYTQIQFIVNGVVKLENWAERQQFIDFCVLSFCTDIGENNIKQIGHDKLLNSGVIHVVNKTVRNYKQIEEGIKYTDGLSHTMPLILKHLPELEKSVKDVMKRDNVHK